VVKYYGSFKQALVHLYPELKLDSDKFESNTLYSINNMHEKKWKQQCCREDSKLIRLFTERYWANLQNRRKFFDEFARENNFDPLIPDNWYGISKRQIKNKQVLLFSLTKRGAKFALWLTMAKTLCQSNCSIALYVMCKGATKSKSNQHTRMATYSEKGLFLIILILFVFAESTEQFGSCTFFLNIGTLFIYTYKLYINCYTFSMRNTFWESMMEATSRRCWTRIITLAWIEVNLWREVPPPPPPPTFIYFYIKYSVFFGI
jgi:hypothetical protein